MERYFVQYIVAQKENDFKAHYVIVEKGTLIYGTVRYKRLANAIKAKEKLERAAEARLNLGVR